MKQLCMQRKALSLTRSLSIRSGVLGERDIPMPSTGNFNAEEIDRYTDSYAYYVTDKIETIRKSCPDAVVLVEQRLDFQTMSRTAWHRRPCIVADDVIQVIDFKYGQRCGCIGRA